MGGHLDQVRPYTEPLLHHTGCKSIWEILGALWAPGWHFQTHPRQLGAASEYDTDFIKWFYNLQGKEQKMSLRDVYSILTTEVLVMFPAMTSNPGQPTLECQLQIRPPAVTCTPGFQHIPTMEFPSGAHNPQTTTPQKYLCNRAHTLWWNLPSHPQHGDKTSPLTSDTRPVWFTLVNLNFMQFHERKFHEIPLISVCYSQKFSLITQLL